MADELRIPIIEEEALLTKRRSATERVRVSTGVATSETVLRDELEHVDVSVTRVRVDREVAGRPPVRTEGDVTIVPVLEERLVVEKRLYLVEELHLRRTVRTEAVEVPVTLRRTDVSVERHDLTPREEH